jgi:Mrp family chromosome partitioning ATPase
MGRTYEALSQSLARNAAAEEDAAVPPTALLPSFRPEAIPAADDVPEAPDAQATSDTALLNELSRDDDTVPFVEVGGPKGSPPVYGPLVGPPTHVPNPFPLRISRPPTPHAATPVWSVTFYPMPELGRPGDLAAALVAFHRPEHPVSAQYRALLAGVAAQQSAGRPLLVFTTVGIGPDAADALLNLALTRAAEGPGRVLVIEADHEQPAVAARLGVADRPGLRELLTRSVPLHVALRPTAAPNLFALPPGDPEQPVPHEAEARLPELVGRLRGRFDWTLVSGPAWGRGGSAEWAGLGDAVYIVIRDGACDTPEAEAAHEAIVAAGGKLRGYISLRTPETAAREAA